MNDGARGRRGRVRQAERAKGNAAVSCCVCACVCLFPSLFPLPSPSLPVSVSLFLSLFFYQRSSLSLSVSLPVAPCPPPPPPPNPSLPLIHTHTQSSLLQAQLLWTPLWPLQLSTLPPTPAHTRDSAHRQTHTSPSCLSLQPVSASASPPWEHLGTSTAPTAVGELRARTHRPGHTPRRTNVRASPHLPTLERPSPCPLPTPSRECLPGRDCAGPRRTAVVSQAPGMTATTPSSQPLPLPPPPPPGERAQLVLWLPLSLSFLCPGALGRILSDS